MLYCGIDIGTTNSKGVLLTDEGLPIGSVSIVNPIDSDAYWYEQFCRIISGFKSQGLLKGEQLCCSIATQGGSFVVLNDELNPTGAAYLWTSENGIAAAKDYIRTFGKPRFYHTTGWEPSGWLAVFKIRNLEILPSEKISFVPEFIYSRLTGELVTDITNAQITGLVDFQRRCYDDAILSWCGIEQRQLARIETDMRIIYEDINTEWGHLHLATSSHDQYAAMEAVGLRSDRDIMIATGTAWVINSRKETAVYDENYILHPGRDFKENSYGNIATLAAVGKGFDELLGKLGLGYKELQEMTAEIETSAAADEQITGRYVAEITKVQNIKRYMEYCASYVRYTLENTAQTSSPETITMTGGAAANDVWPQLIADICRMSVRAVVFDHLTAYGAAVFAARAAGAKFENRLKEIARIKIFYPTDNDIYENWYRLYQKPYFEKLLEKERN